MALACALVFGGGFAAVQSYTGEAQENGLPMVLPYQGTLSKAGAPFTGTQVMQFKLYSDTSGTAFWTSDPRNVEVMGGKFAVTLGDVNDADKLEAQDFRHAELSIELIVDGTALTPKQRIAPAPQAVTAAGASSDFDVPGNLSVGGVLRRRDSNGGTQLLGTYCGVTSPTNGAIVYPLSGAASHVGLEAAQRLCSDACGSPTAHMCTSHEIGISGQFGLRPTNSQTWISSMSYDVSHDDARTPKSVATRDCSGWSNSVGGGSAGLTVQTNGVFMIPTLEFCHQEHPIACCD